MGITVRFKRTFTPKPRGALPESLIDRRSKKNEGLGVNFASENPRIWGLNSRLIPVVRVLIGPDCTISLNFLPLQLKNGTNHIGM